MSTPREQKLVDICFQIAMVSAEYLHGKTVQEIADWTAAQLKGCGFYTEPVGASWGMLMEPPVEQPYGNVTPEIYEPGRPD